MTLREHLNSQFLGGRSMFFHLLTVIESKESSQIFWKVVWYHAESQGTQSDWMLLKMVVGRNLFQTAEFLSRQHPPSRRAAHWAVCGCAFWWWQLVNSHQVLSVNLLSLHSLLFLCRSSSLAGTRRRVCLHPAQCLCSFNPYHPVGGAWRESQHQLCQNGLFCHSHIPHQALLWREGPQVQELLSYSCLPAAGFQGSWVSVQFFCCSIL